MNKPDPTRGRTSVNVEVRPFGAKCDFDEVVRLEGLARLLRKVEHWALIVCWELISWKDGCSLLDCFHIGWVSWSWETWEGFWGQRVLSTFVVYCWNAFVKVIPHSQQSHTRTSQHLSRWLFPLGTVLEAVIALVVHLNERFYVDGARPFSGLDELMLALKLRSNDLDSVNLDHVIVRDEEWRLIRAHHHEPTLIATTLRAATPRARPHSELVCLNRLLAEAVLRSATYMFLVESALEMDVWLLVLVFREIVGKDHSIGVHLGYSGFRNRLLLTKLIGVHDLSRTVNCTFELFEVLVIVLPEGHHPIRPCFVLNALVIRNVTIFTVASLKAVFLLKFLPCEVSATKLWLLIVGRYLMSKLRSRRNESNWARERLFNSLFALIFFWLSRVVCKLPNDIFPYLGPKAALLALHWPSVFAFLLLGRLSLKCRRVRLHVG